MELMGRQEVWNITYDHALGETASWFYTRMRDKERSMAGAARRPGGCWCRRGHSRMRRCCRRRSG